jgi:hypothetical protein
MTDGAALVPETWPTRSVIMLELPGRASVTLGCRDQLPVI